MKNNQKLKGKDLINIGIYAAIYSPLCAVCWAHCWARRC